MIYIVIGPTACGKTSAAIELANCFNAPIINADAFQIYKDMNIGTNKLSKDDPNYNKHYLLDIISPEEDYSVKQYQDDFRKVYSKLIKENENIVICGGTGLYIRAALLDYEFSDENIEKIDYSNYSNEELYAKLVELDKTASEKIHMNNRKRVERALTLIEKTGMKKSDIENAQSHTYFYKDLEYKFLFINPDRESLYEKINLRVDEMFENGLVEEVKMLMKKYSLSQTAKQAIGYKEVIDYLEGNISLDEAKSIIKQRTRNYAKRQITFFKNQFKTQLFASKLDLINEVTKNG